MRVSIFQKALIKLKAVKYSNKAIVNNVHKNIGNHCKKNIVPYGF